jgi:two-component system, OmpR family, sensor kinase
MGRLFWKFFFFIMVAQMTAIIGVGIMFSLEKDLSQYSVDLDLSPSAAFLIKSSAATLQYGGPEALRKLILNGERHSIFAIDENQRDLLGRNVPSALIDEAQAILKKAPELHVVDQVHANDGHTYLLFRPSPIDNGQMQMMNGERPPPGNNDHMPLMHDERPPPDNNDHMPLMRGDRPPPHFLFPPVSMLVSIVASLFFAMLLAWYFSQPIRQLKHAFAQAASGNLAERLAPLMGKRRDELADLGRDFDIMTDKLSALMDSQRRLLHDVSHELRSPIARMQASIGLARLQPEKMPATIERIEREGIRMDRLVGELLTLSRLEAGVTGAMEEDIRMEDLLCELINDARFEAEANGRHVEGIPHCKVIIKGGTELLHRAIENVVRNAIKQTAKGTTVAINTRINVEKQHLMISVIDSGPGVPPDELKLIFMPFFRSSRSQKNINGYGLGLAIARRIIEAHGGTISAVNRPEGGLCVDIMLPYDVLDRSEDSST